MVRKITQKGRSKHAGRFIIFYEWQLKSCAFLSLTPIAKAILLELKVRYFGYNNGSIHLSVREAAGVINVAPNTASRGLNELKAKGFIRLSQIGSFHQKSRHATTWILTEHEYAGALATMDFMKLTVEDLHIIDKDRNKTQYTKLTHAVSKCDTRAQQIIT